MSDQQLTPREREVLTHVFAGKDNDEIAHDMSVSVGTVKQTLSHCYQKLGISSARGLFPLVIASQSEKLMAVAE